MLRVLGILLVISFSSPLFGAITFNAGTGACALSATSVTFSATVNAGSNIIMIAGATSLNSPNSSAVTGITFNASAFDGSTLGTASAGMPDLKTEMWIKKNPAVTTANVVVSWSGAGFAASCGGVTVLNGVDQTTPHRTVATASGTSGTTASVAATSVANDWVVDAIGCWFNSCTGAEGAGQTTRVAAVTTTQLNVDMSTETATGVSTTMSYTVSSGDYWAIIAASFIPAATTTVVPGSQTQVGAGR